MGSKVDGSDSLAVEVAPASHWPTMRAIILVVSAEKKGVSSTSGMQITVATSELFQRRADVIVPKHMELMKKAIKERDFETFARVTMTDSNSFHATCLDTYPPIFYLNDVSRAAIRVVEDINRKAGKAVAAYTFDAGPNCVVYFDDENWDVVAGTLNAVLGKLDGWQGKGIKAQGLDDVDAGAVQVLRDGVSRVICTSVGEGPIRTEESLIAENGEPAKK